MNGSRSHAASLVDGILEGKSDLGDVEVGVCPPFVLIPMVADRLAGLLVRQGARVGRATRRHVADLVAKGSAYALDEAAQALEDKLGREHFLHGRAHVGIELWRRVAPRSRCAGESASGAPEGGDVLENARALFRAGSGDRRTWCLPMRSGGRCGHPAAHA